VGFLRGGKICRETPAGMEKPVWDSCGSVAVFEFFGATINHKMGWKTSLWGRVQNGMGVGQGYNKILRRWAGTEVKVDGDGWRWKLNQRGRVGMDIISVPM